MSPRTRFVVAVVLALAAATWSLASLPGPRVAAALAAGSLVWALLEVRWERAESLRAALEAERERFDRRLTEERGLWEMGLRATLDTEHERGSQALAEALEPERAAWLACLDERLQAEAIRRAESIEEAVRREREERARAVAGEREERNLALAREREERALTMARERAERALTMAREREERDHAVSREQEERSRGLAQRDAKGFLLFSRVLSDDDVRILTTTWSRALKIPVEPNRLRYLRHRVDQVESLCHGRLAGAVQDAILRLLLAESLPGPELRYLEIGALFGVSAITLHDAASCFFERVHLTLIDPLDGYYGKKNMDVVTGLPVSLPILQRNLERLGIPPEDVRILQGYSTAPEIVAQASRERYHLLFVDGDHTYEGVRADFELYGPLVEPGGYVVFDDYGRENWPDVKRFVDEVVQPSPEFERVGSSWTTVVFRRRPV